MEDKNLEPLVPDMLYKHTQEPEPENAPPETELYSDYVPEELDSDEPPIPQEEPVPLTDSISEEEIPAAVEMDPAEDILPAAEPDIPEEFVLADVFSDEDPEPPEVPSTEDAPADLLPPTVPYCPEEAFTDIPDQEEPAGEDPGFRQPGLEDTRTWISENHQVPLETMFETFDPDAPSQDPPDTETSESIAMSTENSEEEESPSVKKKTTRSRAKSTPTVKKGRPKRKKGYGLFGLPHLAATLLWLVIIVAIGSSLGKLLWVGAADVLAFGRESKMVTVTIVDSDTIDTIAAKLKEVGLVKYPELFKFYASLTGAEEEITTGTFQLNTNLDYHALTNALSPSSSNRTVVKVTIPEGYSCRQIFNLLAASNVCSVESLEEYAANGELPEYWFLEGVERGDRYCLEGYLFPDTYEFYANSTPKEALTRMLSGFNTRYSEEMQAQLDTLNVHLSELMRSDGKSEEFIAANQFTLREVLIVASLIEEETAGTAESATIASVIYNRLYKWGDTPAYLNIDATIYYALDGNIDPTTGNTMVLTSSDLLIDSPFNTYKYTGLTPGPITNPGLASIQAALNPKSTGYYYYVLNPDTGLHQFSKTLEEHEQYIEEFYGSEDGE